MKQCWAQPLEKSKFAMRMGAALCFLLMWNLLYHVDVQRYFWKKSQDDCKWVH